MAVGFGLLKLSSRDFWTLTPRELAAALEPFGDTPRPPERDVLAALMARFPD